jgi:serine/threonine protein kinase
MARRQFKRLLFESPSSASGEERELQYDDFDFERRLGEGAFGIVWRAKHKVTGQLYAVKQVGKEKVMQMLPQFKREVRIMYEMSHVHIVKLYNHFEDDQNFYLIMELADSNLYTQLNREKQFLERVAAQYFREAVLAVEYLHSHAPPIIHRDIKPENILLDRNGRIKLTDFGWSNYSSETTTRLTLCGTMEYLPPEMVTQTGHDTAADIWCLGVLLFEMLAGYTPFKNNEQNKLLDK